MRKLITSDVFKMARIIKEAKIKNAITELFKERKKKPVGDELLEEKQEEAGFEAIMMVFEACSTEKTEKMLYEFLGGVTEKEPDKVANQSLEVTIEDIKTIVSENSIFNFFKQASQLTK